MTQKQFKKQFRKRFEEHFARLHLMFGEVVQTDDLSLVAALIAVCSDALVYCVFKMSNGDIDQTAQRVSDAVNLSLETTRKNLK